MTKGKELQHEVRKAVAAYVDELILSRTGAGKGCAVSAHDLLVAAKTAGQKAKAKSADFYVPVKLEFGNQGNDNDNLPEIHVKSEVVPVNRNEANDLLDQFVRPGMSMLRDSGRNDDKFVRKYAGGGGGGGGQREKKRGGPVKHRKDYHWMAWKTTPTPAPETPYPPMTPAPPPRPPTVRPASMAAPTPCPPTPELDIPEYSPPPSRAATVTGYAAYTPVPPGGVPGLREETPVYPLPRNDTPASMKADYRDYLASPQVVPADKAMGNVRENGNPKFVPAMKAWVTNANDYEKDVAYSLLKCLNGGASAGPKRGQPVFNAANGLTRLNTRPRTAGVHTSVPVWKQSYSQPHRETQRLNALGKSMERQGARSYRSNSVVGSEVPVHSYPNRGESAPQGFVHEASFFQFVPNSNSMQPYRGNFTIHPEWVSEVKTYKHAPKQMRTTKGKSGIRYASK